MGEPAAREPEYLYLTTTGWKSGRRHEIEIWFTSVDGCWYLLAERGDRSHWVQNLRHDPRVIVRLNDLEIAARAVVIADDDCSDLAARVRARSRQKYGWGGGTVVELRIEERLPKNSASG